MTGQAWRRIAPAALVAACGSVGSVGGVEAQETSRWTFRLEGGQATIHRATQDGWIFGGALGRESGDRRARLELALAAGSADEGFVSGAGGLEVSLLPDSRITPIAIVQLGLLAEPEYGGWVAGAGAGIRVRLQGPLALRGVLSRGLHGGESGPHTLFAGIEFPVGRSAR